jgi:hypothetical protein
MSRPSFQRIMDGIKIYDDYFAKRMSLARWASLLSINAHHWLGCLLMKLPLVHKYMRMRECTYLEAMYKFNIDCMH